MEIIKPNNQLILISNQSCMIEEYHQQQVFWPPSPTCWPSDLWNCNRGRTCYPTLVKIHFCRSIFWHSLETSETLIHPVTEHGWCTWHQRLLFLRVRTLTHTHMDTNVCVCVSSLVQRCRLIKTGRWCTETPTSMGWWEKQSSWSAAPPYLTCTYGASPSPGLRP